MAAVSNRRPGTQIERRAGNELEPLHHVGRLPRLQLQLGLRLRGGGGGGQAEGLDAELREMQARVQELEAQANALRLQELECFAGRHSSDAAGGTVGVGGRHGQDDPVAEMLKMTRANLGATTMPAEVANMREALADLGVSRMDTDASIPSEAANIRDAPVGLGASRTDIGSSIPTEVADIREALAGLGGSRNHLLQVVRHVLNMSMAPLMKALEEGNLAALSAEAHRMGGNAIYLHAKSFCAACNSLKSFALTDTATDVEAVRPFVQTVAERFGVLTAGLKRVERILGRGMS